MLEVDAESSTDWTETNKDMIEPKHTRKPQKNTRKENEKMNQSKTRKLETITDTVFCPIQFGRHYQESPEHRP